MNTHNENKIDITEAVDMLYNYWQKIGENNSENLKDFIETIVKGLYTKYILKYIHDQLKNKPNDTYNPDNLN